MVHPVPVCQCSAQLVHRLVDGGHFKDIAAGVARSALPGQRRRFRQAGRAKTLAVADQELLLLQRAQRALDLEAGQSGRVNRSPSSSSRLPLPRERPATPSDPSSSTCSSALRSGHRAAPEPAEIGARVTASSRMYAAFTQTDCSSRIARIGPNCKPMLRGDPICIDNSISAGRRDL